MYIRTKDGVYEVDKNTKGTEDFLWVKTNKANVVQCVWLNCIINQSENLEELCDEFVLIEHYSDRKDKYHHRDKESFIRDYIGYEHIDIVLSYYTIYGAIYTDKGLIYVAKMDSDGELELI